MALREPRTCRHDAHRRAGSALQQVRVDARWRIARALPTNALFNSNWSPHNPAPEFVPACDQSCCTPPNSA